MQILVPVMLQVSYIMISILISIMYEYTIKYTEYIENISKLYLCIYQIFIYVTEHTLLSKCIHLKYTLINSNKLYSCFFFLVISISRNPGSAIWCSDSVKCSVFSTLKMT